MEKKGIPYDNDYVWLSLRAAWNLLDRGEEVTAYELMNASFTYESLTAVQRQLYYGFLARGVGVYSKKTVQKRSYNGRRRPFFVYKKLYSVNVISLGRNKRYARTKTETSEKIDSENLDLSQIGEAVVYAIEKYKTDIEKYKTRISELENEVICKDKDITSLQQRLNGIQMSRKVSLSDL